MGNKFNVGDIVQVKQVYCWGLEGGPYIWADHPAIDKFCEIVFRPVYGSSNPENRYFVKLTTPIEYTPGIITETWAVTGDQIVLVYDA